MPERPTEALLGHSSGTPDPLEAGREVCEYDGHEWAAAGGGMLICMRCEAEEWDYGLPEEQEPRACPQCGEIDCMEDTHDG